MNKNTALAVETQPLYVREIILVVLVSVAAIAAWVARFDMIPDGVSYLDLAQRAANGDWSGIINGYWNPLYPTVLGLPLRVLRLSPESQFSFFHALNFAVYVVALLAFDYFWRACLRFSATARIAPYFSRVQHLACGYSVFAVCCLGAIGLSVCNPDMFVAAACFCAAGITVRIGDGDRRNRHYVLLAVVLALGYYAKAIMFPVAIAFLIAAWLAGGRETSRKVLLSAIIYFMLSAPLVIVMSERMQRPTYSDTGRIAYALYVDYRALGVMHPWMGKPDGSGTPTHPLTQVSNRPLIVACETNWNVSDPFGFDPVYWRDGMRVFFNPRGQVYAFYDNFMALSRMLFGIFGPAVAALTFLFLASDSGTITPLQRRRTLFLFVPFVAALGLYLLVLVEPRYIAPFFPLACAGFLCAINLTPSGVIRPFIRSAVALVVVGSALALMTDNVPAARRARSASIGVVNSARELRAILYPGARVAVLGRDVDAPRLVYLSRLRMDGFMATDEESKFWSMSGTERELVLHKLARMGFAAAIGHNAPFTAFKEGWLQLGTGPYSVKLLVDAAQPGHPAAE